MDKNLDFIGTIFNHGLNPAKIEKSLNSRFEMVRGDKSLFLRTMKSDIHRYQEDVSIKAAGMATMGTIGIAYSVLTRTIATIIFEWIQAKEKEIPYSGPDLFKDASPEEAKPHYSLLTELEKIDYADYDKIRSEQEKAFAENTSRHLDIRIEIFLDQYKQTVIKEELLRLEIAMTKKRIGLYRTNYKKIYIQTLKGEDGRYALEPHHIDLIHNHYEGIWPIEGTHLDLIIHLKYLEWLMWFKKDEQREGKEPFINKEDIYPSELYEVLSPSPQPCSATATALHQDVVDMGQSKSGFCFKPDKIFRWQKSPDALATLFEGLTDAKLINCKMENLQAIMGLECKNTVPVSLQWKGGPTLLSYLLYELKPMIDKDSYDLKWSIAQNVFFKESPGDLAGTNLPDLFNKTLGNKQMADWVSLNEPA